ncbi:MAG TPA: hypothetical protein VMX55_13290 [candidate division Zixibacteria bacterium]|nr:hypothetical protein [candidate division Zixibacteria bacterium]
MKRKIGNSLIILGIFAMFLTMQISSVSALTCYFDSASYNKIDAWQDVRMTCQVKIWAGPKAGGGVYMNHEYFTVTCRVIDGKALSCTVTFKIQNQQYFYECYDSVEIDPGTYYYEFNDYYVYKSSYMVVYSDISVTLEWEDALHVHHQVTISAEASYEGYN